MEELDHITLPSGKDLTFGGYQPGGPDQALAEGRSMVPSQYVIEVAPGQRVSLDP